ncbi:MogA/MoaB family molybdenum cofactor biosynthesis protein [candidate division KSB1 bacterium]
MFNTVVFTISDSCFSGERKDDSGPMVEASLPPEAYQVLEHKILPDDLDVIKGALMHFVNRGDIDLILTTGGTGFGPRDVTPEATAMVLQKKTPGIDILTLSNSVKSTPYAALSRAISGIRNNTLIINLPGRPEAVKENVEILLPILPHALKLIADRSPEEEHHFEN